MTDVEDEGGQGGQQPSNSMATPGRAKHVETEDHWSVVLKKLAPQGYQKSPQWQQEIIGRVVKQMAARQKDGAKRSASQNSIDLTALGVSQEAAEVFQQEERRVAKTMRNLPGIGISLNSGGMASTHTFPDAAGLEGGVKPELSVLDKMLAERSNLAGVAPHIAI